MYRCAQCDAPAQMNCECYTQMESPVPMELETPQPKRCGSAWCSQRCIAPDGCLYQKKFIGSGEDANLEMMAMEIT